MSDKPKKSYKYCIVPKCKSTSIATPDKIFFSVPKDQTLRKKWCIAIKRDEKKNPLLSPKSTLYCCEDHFTLNEDMKNYWQYKIIGSIKRKELKKGVLPHLFECQKSCSVPISNRPAAAKRKRKQLINEIEENYKNKEKTKNEQLREIEEIYVDGTHQMEMKNNDKAIQVHIQSPKRYCRSKGTMTMQKGSTSISLSPIRIPPVSVTTSSIKQQDGVKKVLYSPSETSVTYSNADSDGSESSECAEAMSDESSIMNYSPEEKETAAEFTTSMRKGLQRRKVWMNLVGKYNVTDNTRTCALHFPENNFENKRLDGNKLLTPNTVPDLQVTACFCSNEPQLLASSTHVEPNIKNIEKFENILLSEAHIGADIKDIVKTEKFSPEIHSELSIEDTVKIENFSEIEFSSELHTELDIDDIMKTENMSDPETDLHNESIEDTVRMENIADSEMCNQKQRQVIENLRKCLKRTLRERNALKKKIENLKKNIKKCLNEDQIYALGHDNAQGHLWSDETIEKATKLYKSCGNKGYEEIRRQGFPFPSVRTIQNMIATVNSEINLEHSSDVTSI